MTREEVKALLGDVSKENLDSIMALNGKDIEKTKVTAQTQIGELNSQLFTGDCSPITVQPIFATLSSDEFKKGQKNIPSVP